VRTCVRAYVRAYVIVRAYACACLCNYGFAVFVHVLTSVTT
jgi:hypothetical protein